MSGTRETEQLVHTGEELGERATSTAFLSTFATRNGGRLPCVCSGEGRGAARQRGAFPSSCTARLSAPVTYVGPAYCGELPNQETVCRRGGRARLGESKRAPSPAPWALRRWGWTLRATALGGFFTFARAQLTAGSSRGTRTCHGVKRTGGGLSRVERTRRGPEGVFESFVAREASCFCALVFYSQTLALCCVIAVRDTCTCCLPTTACLQQRGRLALSVLSCVRPSLF